MKRSQALEIIRLCHFDDIYGYSDQELGEAILSKLEQAGMLPPRTELKSMPGTFDNAWEPETGGSYGDTTDPEFVPF